MSTNNACKNVLDIPLKREDLKVLSYVGVLPLKRPKQTLWERIKKVISSIWSWIKRQDEQAAHIHRCIQASKEDFNRKNYFFHIR